MNKNGLFKNILLGISSINIFQEPEPLKPSSIENAFSGVWQSFALAGNSINKATNEFDTTNKKTKPTK